MKKKALITGITGQDGAYLAELLIKKGYTIIGTSRLKSKKDLWRLRHLKIDKNLKIYNSSIIKTKKIYSFFRKHKFDEIYNLSGISSVQKSFDFPIATFQTNTLDCLNILNAINYLKLKSRFYQASSSEMFGNTQSKCNERTPFKPLSPYAISKLSAHQITINYRNNYNIHASNGILFNHESPLRSKDFVSKKIIEGLVQIKNLKKKTLKVGNIYAKRDWGHAKDFVRGMHLILNYKKPDDFIITSEQNYSVKDLINTACEILEIKGLWKGSGLNEFYEHNGKKIITIDKDLFRPLDLLIMNGNAYKARNKLGWSPKFSFTKLIHNMIEFEINKFT